jgi:hypothetical protein
MSTARLGGADNAAATAAAVASRVMIQRDIFLSTEVHGHYAPETVKISVRIGAFGLILVT